MMEKANVPKIVMFISTWAITPSMMNVCCHVPSAAINVITVTIL